MDAMAKIVVLVSTDLLAQSRVAAAAEAAGWGYATAHPKMAQTTPGPLQGDLIIYDLDALEAGRVGNTAPGKRTVGFFSHIDKRKKASADKLGIEAIPRGRFWRELPALLAEPGS
jgi:hypothetical protein